MHSENVTYDYEVIHEAESVGRETSSIEWHHFHLHHKDQVYVNLRAINQALNHIDTPTDGILVDLTPPMLRYLGDGLVVGQDADFQVSWLLLSIRVVLTKAVVVVCTDHATPTQYRLLA